MFSKGGRKLENPRETLYTHTQEKQAKLHIDSNSGGVRIELGNMSSHGQYGKKIISLFLKAFLQHFDIKIDYYLF